MKITAIRPASVICIALLGSACSSHLPYPDPPQTAAARTPAINIDSAAGNASMEITVLIYNVAGLPWPIGCGKKSRTIDDRGKQRVHRGTQLLERRENG